MLAPHVAVNLRPCLAGIALSLLASGCTSVGADRRVSLEQSREGMHLTPPRAHDCQDHADEDDDVAARELARIPVGWRHGGPRPGRQIPVQILGFNDFHGQLSPRTVSSRPAGGAAVLSSYLRAASVGQEDRTFIVHAGDYVGASPPSSALLQDEPSISFLNTLTSRRCSYHQRGNDDCNVIGTLGNHEFDEGKGELFRLIDGGNHPSGPFLEPRWKGARYGFVSANVVDSATGKTILPPYAIRRVDGVPIAFIGAVLKETPTIVTPTGVAGLTFLDEADAINSYIPELHRKGVHAIIVQIHQGVGQTSYTGPTDAGAPAPSGALSSIVSRLDDDIDVIVSGHTHQFTNALVLNQNGKQMLVAQAFSGGTAYDDIDLVLDSKTRDVVSMTASIVTTWGDEGPGLTPDASAAAIVSAADAKVAPLVSEVIGSAATAITRTQTSAGESALGNLIAEAQRVSIGAQFAVMNMGGIRADLAAGTVTWGQLFTVQPFGNTVVGLDLTGQQIYDLLNQQWGAPQPAGGRILQIAGFSYTWDSAVAEGGQRVVEVRDATNAPIDRGATYRMAANNFIAAGGDNFTVLRNGTNQIGGPIDLDALIAYVESLPQPFSAATDSRIVRQ
jgi:5'-nucleotidase